MSKTARKVAAGCLVFLGLFLLFALGLGGSILHHGFGNYLRSLTRVRLSYWLTPAAEVALIVAGWYIYPRRRKPAQTRPERQADDGSVWPPAPKQN